jgi:hypothetical protein
MFALALLSTVPCRAQPEMSVRANFSDLNEYGEWIHVHGYGTVWRPDAEPGWRPFMYGHWVYSSDGWLWDSDEPFGWVVCHYGNWYHDESLGWLWVPGYEWSPAQVQWNVSDDEIAWAPLPPSMVEGRRHHEFGQVEWMTCPAPFFTAPELRAHVEIRGWAAGGERRVHVHSSTPPRLDFVQRMVRAPVITVVPNKVHVAGRERPLVRVEVRNQARPNVVVPVGPRFRRTTVRTEAKQPTEVNVTTDQGTRRDVPLQPQPSVRVRVTPSGERPYEDGNSQDNSVRVRTQPDRDVPVRVETK